MVGASRQWVTMTLDRFQTDGIIRVGKRRTVILAPDALRTSAVPERGRRLNSVCPSQWACDHRLASNAASGSP